MEIQRIRKFGSQVTSEEWKSKEFVSAFVSWALDIWVSAFGYWALDIWISAFGYWALDSFHFELILNRSGFHFEFLVRFSFGLLLNG
ncbi:unnamed protein product [Rhizophagus irregularis]|nr:unnamed protein product [Rhizophagus irregularis]